MSLTRTLGHYGSLVKISHTVFALPFALSAVVLASAFAPLTARKVMLIVVCIAAARTAAMAFNRLVDRDIDAKNPRTEIRELPQGVLSAGSVRLLVLASSAVFLGAAALLGELPLMLSPIALGLALGYSYTKRFTSLCHVVLGAAVALAPGGAWIAMGAEVTLAPWLLVGGVACWVGGFDVLYSLQDQGFDQGERLHSIPVTFGVVGSLWISALMHVITVGCLLAVGVLLERGAAYFVGVALVGLLLAYEHVIVKPSDLSRIDKAFFDINGYVSVAFFGCVLLDQVLS
ncbi:MAG: putative 4-hydroxybenzoate polyprenyltransferase [Myxococcales bacterium]|nr:putative 4-hydroxybenzoate polyprenyltransferase [Myxococcales bacterium]